MTTYITRSSNSSPVAIKAGGGEQGRIGKSVEINVITWNGNWARFDSPVIISGEQNWIRGDYISQVGEPEPPTPDGPDVQVTRVEGTLDGEPFVWQP